MPKALLVCGPVRWLVSGAAESSENGAFWGGVMGTGGDVEGRERHALSAHLLNGPFTEDRETIRQSQHVLCIMYCAFTVLLHPCNYNKY